MPLPTPSKNEKESDFMKRCMPIATKEAKDNKQAVAICMSQFRKKSKSLFEKADEEYRTSMRMEQTILEEESSADYKYRNPKTGEVFTYTRRGLHKKDGVVLIYEGKA
tara:strand:+ start:49 stop:372 length:324 start_codon:yes stop_codon:yes gene_type:complete